MTGGISLIDPTEAQRLSLFDYASLPNDVADAARAAATRIRGGMKSAIIEAGREFIAIKARLPHGSFLPWVQAEFGGMSERTVQRYMRAAEALGEVKSDTVSDLPAKVIHKLSAKSTPPEARERVITVVEAEARRLSPKEIGDIAQEEISRAKGDVVTVMTETAPVQTAVKVIEAFVNPPTADDVLLAFIDAQRKVWAAERLMRLVEHPDDLALEALETLGSEVIALDDWREWFRHRINERCYRRFQALRDGSQRRRALPRSERAEKPAGPEAEEPEDRLPTDDPRWFEGRDSRGRRAPLPKLQLDILRALQKEGRQPIGDRVDHLMMSADIIAALGLPADDNPTQCSIAQACRRLVGRGLIVRHIQPGKGSRYFWCLAKEVPAN